MGKLYDPKAGVRRRAYVFVMVRGYSRDMFAQIVFDQSTETWVRLHLEAFEHFGGVPALLVPDNLKAAVIRAAFAVDGKSVLNRSYRELARHHGFKIDPTPPYTPEHKGKVESAVKYVKHNFMRPRDELDVSVLRRQLAMWIDEVAGQRVHGKTRRRPDLIFRMCSVDQFCRPRATRSAALITSLRSVPRERSVLPASRRSVTPTLDSPLSKRAHASCGAVVGALTLFARTSAVRRFVTWESQRLPASPTCREVQPALDNRAEPACGTVPLKEHARAPTSGFSTVSAQGVGDVVNTGC